MRSVVLLFTVTALGYAQSEPVTWGVKAGIPLGDDSSTTVVRGAAQAPVTAGAFVNMKIWKSLSFEFNPMWRRTSREGNGVTEVPIVVPSGDGFGSTTQFRVYHDYKNTSHILDYSFLGRWAFPEMDRWSPFVTAGYVRRWVHSRTRSIALMTPVGADVPTSTDFYTLSSSEWKNGFAVGAGVSLKWRRIRIEPEYRFTGVPNGAQTVPGTRVGEFLSPLRMDKTHDILFGIRF